MPTMQYFALDSTDPDHATRIAALATASVQYLSYTPTVVQRPAAHDSNIVIVAVVVEEADLTGDLADLAASAYPNATCRHRWTTLPGFRTSGFHMLGESVRSYEAAGGRVAVHIRPQTGTTTGNPQVPGGPGYGAGNGLTDYDAANGPIDAATLGGVSTHLYETGKSYFYKGLHVRRGHTGNGGNAPFGNGVSGNGQLAVADAAGLGAAGEIKFYYGGDGSPLGPGMFWGTMITWDKQTGLPWEEYGSGSGIYVNGGFQGSTTGNHIGKTSVQHDCDIEDITIDADLLTKRHHLKGQINISDLNGASGRGRYYVQTSFGQGTGDWDAVLYFDGMSTWTDLTEAANNATADDWEAFAAGASDGAMLVFVTTAQPASGMQINLSQVQVGGMIVPRYSLGGGGNLGTFTNIIDPTNGLTSGSGNQTIEFNPKADWATETYAAGETFGITGYGFVFTKTSGTITQAARGDQTQRQHRACFVHRWNDGAPTLGITCTESAAGGLRHVLTDVGNVEFINARLAVRNQWGAHNGAKDITLTGSQYLPYGDMQTSSAVMAFTARASQTDKGQAVWWSIDDIVVKDKTHPVIQGALAEVVRSIANGHGGDLTKFDDMPEWSDIAYAINGPYSNVSVSGGALRPITIDGLRIRKCGMKHDTLNDSEAIDLYVNTDPTDHHSFALRGGENADSFTLERLGFEHFQAAVELHPTAAGDNDVPVGGDNSPAKNYRFRYGYHYQHNGYFDPGQPLGAFKFSGNNEIGAHENGKTGNVGNRVEFWGFDEINDTENDAGVAIGSNNEDGPTVRYCYFGQNVRVWWSVGKSFGRESSNAVTFDGASTYNDITANLLVSSGGVTTPLFGAGTAGNRLYVGVSVRPLNRFFFDLSTAGAGGAVLAVRYFNGSSFTAVANLVDGTNGLTQDGQISWDRPSDGQQSDVNGTTKYWYEIEIVSGSYSAVPQAVEIGTRYVGATIDIQYYSGAPVHIIGRQVTNRWSENSAWIIDDHANIQLKPGQTTATKFYKIGSTSTDTPDLDLSQWQATTKGKLTTAAERDSVFAPNHDMQETA